MEITIDRAPRCRTIRTGLHGQPFDGSPLEKINQLLNIASNLDPADLLSIIKSLFWTCRGASFFTSRDQRIERNTSHQVPTVR